MHVKVRVRAGARRETFEAESASSFKISVREKAAGNAANRRIIQLVAAHFNVSPKAVRLVSGHHSPSKLFHIRGIR